MLLPTIGDPRAMPPVDPWPRADLFPAKYDSNGNFLPRVPAPPTQGGRHQAPYGMQSDGTRRHEALHVRIENPLGKYALRPLVRR